MTYKVVYPNKNCQKQFNKVLKPLPLKLQDAIMKAVTDLGGNPRPNGCIALDPPLQVLSYFAEFRIRIGDYRVLYDINNKEKKVYIFALRRRNNQTYRR